jgi:hypothetical protein
MGNSGSEGIERPREKLRNLYEHEGEAAVRTERDEAEHQTARACGNLEEVTSEYLTALAAVHSAGQLIDIYDASDAWMCTISLDRCSGKNRFACSSKSQATWRSQTT